MQYCQEWNNINNNNIIAYIYRYCRVHITFLVFSLLLFLIFNTLISPSYQFCWLLLLNTICRMLSSFENSQRFLSIAIVFPHMNIVHDSLLFAFVLIVYIRIYAWLFRYFFFSIFMKLPCHAIANRCTYTRLTFKWSNSLCWSCCRCRCA